MYVYHVRTMFAASLNLSKILLLCGKLLDFPSPTPRRNWFQLLKMAGLEVNRGQNMRHMQAALQTRLEDVVEL